MNNSRVEKNRYFSGVSNFSNVLSLFLDISSRWLSKRTYPYKLIFSVTNKCNQKCKTCNIWKKERGDELSLKEINEVFEKYGRIRWLSLTGGEPFLRKDFLDITSSAVKTNPIAVLNIPTNGSNPKKIHKTVKKILRLKIPLVYVTISLDGPPEVHNRLRGVEDAWSNAVKTYKNLKKIKNRSLNVYFEHLLSPFNLGEFGKCIANVKEKVPNIEGKDFHLTLYQKSKHYYDNLSKTKTENYEERLLGEMKKAKKTLNSKKSISGPSRLMNDIFVEYVLKGLMDNELPDCSAIKSFNFLSSNGDVYPCPFFNRKLGNVRNWDYNLKRILNSSEAKSASREISDKKCPGCWSPCTAHSRMIEKPSILLKAIRRFI